MLASSVGSIEREQFGLCSQGQHLASHGEDFEERQRKQPRKAAVIRKKLGSYYTSHCVSSIENAFSVSIISQGRVKIHPPLPSFLPIMELNKGCWKCQITKAKQIVH